MAVQPTGRTTICKVYNATAETISLKPGVPLSTVERADKNEINVMESLVKEIGAEWSQINEIGVRLDYEMLTA